MAGPLKIQMNVNLKELLESPPPGSPFPVLPQPIALGELSPVCELRDIGTNLLNNYTRADTLVLKRCAQVTKDRINGNGYVVEEPMVSQNLAAYLQQHYGPQWKMKILRPAAEPIFEHLLANLKGYAKLTNPNRRLLR